MAKSDQHISRRRMLKTTVGTCGLSLPSMLQLQNAAARSAEPSNGKAKCCIVLFCWGGMSHLESWDMKPDAPQEIRGEFFPISTATPGIQISEHLPRLALQTDKLAIVRSIHHVDAEHGRGMYQNLTGHKPPGVGKISPTRRDWPSLPAMVSKLRAAPAGVPSAVRLPYPMVDGIVQAGESGGWLGSKYDPVLIRTPRGEPYGGISNSPGSEPLNLGEIDSARFATQTRLLSRLEGPVGTSGDFESFDHFREMAHEILVGSAVRDAYDLDKEDDKIRESYGNHIGGQSMLLARRLTEAGVPIVQVCCAAGNLNGGDGDMWDTHRDSFNRLRDRLFPVFDRGFSALLDDLAGRGTLDETLVVMLTDFGRTPKINGAAGRDHYPSVYSVVLAGGGIRGGQVYGSSDDNGAFPKTKPCGPPDIHATIFRALGISPRATIRDQLDRPLPVSDGEVLPLFG